MHLIRRFVVFVVLIGATCHVLAADSLHEQIIGSASNLLQERLAKDYHVDKAAVSVSVVNMPDVNALSEAPPVVQARLPKQAIKHNRRLVYVDVVENSYQYTLPIWFKVNVQKEIYLANDDINANALIKADLFTVSATDVSNLDGGQLINTLPEDTLLKKPLKKGQALVDSNLKPKSLIQVGAQVSAIYEGNGVQIKQSMIASQAGNLGDVINVHKPKHYTVFKAKIIGKNKVVVI